MGDIVFIPLNDDARIEISNMRIELPPGVSLDFTQLKQGVVCDNEFIVITTEDDK